MPYATTTDSALYSPCSQKSKEATVMRIPCTAIKSSPHPPQLGKSLWSNEDPVQPQVNKYRKLSKKKSCGYILTEIPSYRAWFLTSCKDTRERERENCPLSALPLPLPRELFGLSLGGVWRGRPSQRYPSLPTPEWLHL